MLRTLKHYSVISSAAVANETANISGYCQAAKRLLPSFNCQKVTAKLQRAKSFFWNRKSRDLNFRTIRWVFTEKISLNFTLFSIARHIYITADPFLIKMSIYLVMGNRVLPHSSQVNMQLHGYCNTKV